MASDGYDITQADTREIFGDQGQGKSCTAVALVADDCHANITGIRNPTTKEYFKARALNDQEIQTLESQGVKYNPLKHIRIFKSDSISKIVAKPKGFAVESSVKVFANFHFYGIRFKFIDQNFLIENINDDILTNAWLVLDESILTDKQDSMSRAGKLLAKFGAQGRKRKLHTIIIAQYPDMINSRFTRFATTRVTCTYDKHTNMIDLDVNKSSEYMTSTSFYAPYYWPFYEHDEKIKIPQKSIDDFLEGAYR